MSGRRLAAMANLDGLALLHEKGACKNAAVEFDDGLTPWSAQGAVRDQGANKRFIARYCDVCEVRAECLEFAIAVPANLDYHVWGGMTRGQRAELRKARLASGERQPSKPGTDEWSLEPWIDLDLRDKRDVGVPAEVGLVG